MRNSLHFSERNDGNLQSECGSYVIMAPNRWYAYDRTCNILYLGTLIGRAPLRVAKRTCENHAPRPEGVKP